MMRLRHFINMSQTCIVGRNVSIPKNFITKERVLKDLVISDTRDSDFESRQDLVCFEETEEFYKVPFIYGRNFVLQNNLPSKTVIHKGDKIDVSFSGKLREQQIPVVEKAAQVIKQEGGAVLNLYCGFGKTTVANYLSCKIKRKTLILVHTSSLVEQWKDRICQFVNGASVGLIRQKTFDIEEKTHVIGLMQSISRRDYGTNAFDSFGLLICDEAHHLPAQELSKCMKIAGTRYRIGLSATPFRKDGFHPFLFNSIGRIACSVERKEDSQELLVEAIFIKNGPDTVHTTWRAGGKKSINMARMISDLYESPESVDRTRNVCRIILSKVSEGRKMIILSDRRGHLDNIAQFLLQNGLPEVGFLIGGKKKEEMKEAEEAQVIMATYAFCAEGVDIPTLDTAIFATPRSDVIQTTGRILRKNDDKKTPTIVDVVDDPFVFRNQFKKREAYYATLGAKVEYFDEEHVPFEKNNKNKNKNKRKVEEKKEDTNMFKMFKFDN